MPSGTIWGSFSNKSTSVARPYLTWSYTQSIANNTSTVTANLYFVRYDGYRAWNNDPSTFYITINGSTGSSAQPYDIGPNGKTDHIFSRTVTVAHNDDGRKSISLSASGNTNNSVLGTISLSGSIVLDIIPRASDFTAFALSDQYLGVSQANTVTYTLDRKSSSFTHYMTLKAGSSTIKSWWDSGTGSRTWSLTSSEVNEIIKKAPNSEGITLYLTMQTKDGSSNVGSSKTLSDWVGLESSIKPTASSLSVSRYGSGRDTVIGYYVQSISKVTASFSASAGYGASISASRITVRRQSDGANSQNINGTSGTTGNPLDLSGTYIIEAYIKDSRGREDTVTAIIEVQPYSPPKISTFTAYRGSTNSTNVGSTIVASWTPLSSSNPANVSVVGVDNSGSSTTHYTLNGSTAGLVDTSQTYSGQSDASSYEYTITVTDSFGKKATAVATVGTSFVEFTISKGRGIGVGKVWEQGALDINGDIYLNNTKFGTLGDGSIRVTTPGGYVEFGPKNTSYSHIYSDRNFYFNRHATFAGGIQVSGDAKATGRMEASITHTNGYFNINPYSSSYDDGSHVRSYYNGTDSEWYFYISGSSGTRGLTMRAGNFSTSSTEDLKEDIEEFNTSVLEMYRTGMKIHKYRMRGDKPGCKLKHGLVIGEGYKTPVELIDDNGLGISLYEFATFNAKAIQELIAEIDQMKRGWHSERR